jgi:hypothetical protein
MYYRYAAVSHYGPADNSAGALLSIQGNTICNGEFSGESKDTFLAVVCDGGPFNCNGAEASRLASAPFSAGFMKRQDPISICHAIYSANCKIGKMNWQKSQSEKLSTQLAGVYLDEKSTIAFNLGQLSVYRVYQYGFTKISDDYAKGESFQKQASGVLDGRKGALGVVLSGDISRSDHVGTFLVCSNEARRIIKKNRISSSLASLGSVSLIERCRIVYQEALSEGIHEDFIVVLVDAKWSQGSTKIIPSSHLAHSS